MSTSPIKRKFLLQLTLLTVVIGWVGAGVFHYCLPGHYFEGYPFILVYFYLFGILSIQLFDACLRRAPQKLLLFYMAMKVMKMVLSLLVLVVYCMVVRQQAQTFLLTFISLYLVYLIYESWFFFCFEWSRKQKKINKDETVA